MRHFILILAGAVAIGFSACTNEGHDGHHHEMTKERMDSMRDDLMKTDLAFSQMSEEKGRNAAFLEYTGDNATLLRPYSMPVTGKDSITSLLSAYPDSGRRLTWIPISADVARSGEIGFTYGTYAVVHSDGYKEEGTYATVWHKNKDKKWKVLLDTGNEGLSMETRSTDKEEHKKEKAEKKK